MKKMLLLGRSLRNVVQIGTCLLTQIAVWVLHSLATLKLTPSYLSKYIF
ncbi:hypothetical protein [Chlorogloeopsis fritschii]|nr:hypothetical protein [Chlorogloeopsis fritschii]